MIKRTRYPKEFRDGLIAEIKLGQSTIAQVSKRENISGQTLRNWIDNGATGKTGSEQQEIAALRRKVEELSAALGEIAFENHVLKKFQRFLEQKRKSVSLSGPLSPPKSASSEPVG
jgi:transposase-like protein